MKSALFWCNRKRLVWSGVVACLLFWTANADALSIRRPYVKELVHHAEWVVFAEVKGNKQEVTPQGIPMLRTTFTVLRTLKGAALKQVDIRLPGGQSKTHRIQLPLPRFTPKSRVYLLLRKSKHNPNPILVALYYGIFDVVTRQGKTLVTHRGHLLPAMSVDAFERTLRALLQATVPLQTPTKKR